MAENRSMLEQELSVTVMKSCSSVVVKTVARRLMIGLVVKIGENIIILIYEENEKTRSFYLN
jgi:hypothetical protein